MRSPALTARRLAATLKAGGEGFAYRSTAQVAGTLDLNDAAPLSPKPLPACTAGAPRVAPQALTPHHRLQPAPNRLGPQHTSSSTHCRPWQARAHSVGPYWPEWTGPEEPGARSPSAWLERRNVGLRGKQRTTEKLSKYWWLPTDRPNLRLGSKGNKLPKMGSVSFSMSDSR